MTRLSLCLLSAVCIASTDGRFACDAEAPATVSAPRVVEQPAASTSLPMDVRGLIGQAHGASPMLCGLAADGLTGWGGRWDDAPATPIGVAVRARVRRFPRGDELTPAEVRFLTDSIASSDACVRELSIRLLGNFGGDAVAEQLVTLLGSSQTAGPVRETAALGLGMIGGKVGITVLLRALRDEEAGVRANAIWALGRANDGRAVALIRDLLTDELVMVRQAAAVALGRLDSLSSAEPLARVLREDKTEGVRRNAAWALGELEAKRAAPALATALQSDRDSEVREMAAWALGEMETRDQAGTLVRALANDSSAAVRETAAWALGSMEAKDASEALGAAAGGDPRPRVRGTAAWALGQIEPPAAPRGLIKALADPEVDVRTKAAWALSEIGDTTATAAVQDAFRRETDSRARRAQVRAIMHGGKASQEAFGEMLRSMDPEVRKAAVRGLAGEGQSDVWPWPWPRPRPNP
ncbi:MAG: HEAT repeat domain-containing protein [Gemmatimonadaceae bacterium]